ncbi:acyl-CoA thioesterase [Tenacibaculum piscium]|uniref:Thioesterase n=1 Tax=Tenacibaculum piscium TaxID=1458515 RepID=A0A2H1YHG7_9FLAO|nr:thioesterase family protein [Tenacibaculum piscium]MBE7630141.1 acyl-CoA thioesterase [Tenacibaculum piscium]MBE7671071.1 acyl-CoA thioesterase [Tenacibaculum piscium]MBE7685979.1 acyl-CoA thioesterase [Tenacibaculum piscium]MBE7690896.1 acyl-CoA thioesterase [Tenacibaculum piscium]MCG8184179.1 acyl-CoA thioesterase [Tenacibaculum piscium]
MNFYEKKYTVTANEIDEYHHVNNVVYVQWMQEVSINHWLLLIKKVPKPDYVWFVIRHEIDYKSQAVLGDEITVKTWVGNTSGIKSIRHFEMYKGTDLVVKSQTTFCLLDATSQKPRRITKEVTNLLQGKI